MELTARKFWSVVRDQQVRNWKTYEEGTIDDNRSRTQTKASSQPLNESAMTNILPRDLGWAQSMWIRIHGSDSDGQVRVVSRRCVQLHSFTTANEISGVSTLIGPKYHFQQNGKLTELRCVTDVQCSTSWETETTEVLHENRSKCNPRRQLIIEKRSSFRVTRDQSSADDPTLQILQKSILFHFERNGHIIDANFRRVNLWLSTISKWKTRDSPLTFFGACNVFYNIIKSH